MTLTEILQTRRAHNSVGDYLFRAALLKHLAPHHPRIEGEDGSIVVVTAHSGVAFSCHIDTCHGEDEPPTQRILTDNGLITLDDKSQCLGADDGLGIFLMLELIKQGTPGTYIFHTGEEVGAQASRDLGQSDLAEDFDLIVAFDRAVKPGQSPEVIITQSRQECASVTCGQALADQLNLYSNLGYVVSTTGVFTDTLNYAQNVAECLNVGCFYDLQHTPYEYVDLEKFEKLVQAVLQVDWNSLPIERTPHHLPASHDKDDLQFSIAQAALGYCYALDKDLSSYLGFPVKPTYSKEILDYAQDMLLTEPEDAVLGMLCEALSLLDYEEPAWFQA